MQVQRAMRTTSVILSLTAALSLVSGAGCAKKSTATATAVSAPKPAAPAASQEVTPATLGDASVTTDDRTGTAPPSGPIYFEFDSAVLTAESRDLLTTFAAWAFTKQAKLRIEGHTDERGTTEYNLALGDRRARAVADYLIDFGVDQTRVDTITFGEERPAQDGHDAEAWTANRRGEVKTN